MKKSKILADGESPRKLRFTEFLTIDGKVQEVHWQIDSPGSQLNNREVN